MAAFLSFGVDGCISGVNVYFEIGEDRCIFKHIKVEDGRLTS